MNTWAIRDIEHAKTVFFKTYDEMYQWILLGRRGPVDWQEEWDKVTKQLEELKLIKKD